MVRKDFRDRCLQRKTVWEEIQIANNYIRSMFCYHGKCRFKEFSPEEKHQLCRPYQKS